LVVAHLEIVFLLPDKLDELARIGKNLVDQLGRPLVTLLYTLLQVEPLFFQVVEAPDDYVILFAL